MHFEELTNAFERLETAAGRLAMYRVLEELFARADAREIAAVAYLCTGRLLPAFTGVELGMGERLVAAAIAFATGRSQPEIDELYGQLGDLGMVAQRLLVAQPRKHRTVLEVYEALLEIAQQRGAGSVEHKVRLLAALITRLSSHEAHYLVRLTLGRLRLGIGPPTIIEAVAHMYPDSQQARARLEFAYNRCADLGLVLKTLREHGLDALERFTVRVGHPVRMMLAQRASSAEAIIARLGCCAVESKLDGFRCQIHMDERTVDIFSRNLERTTAMFPDLVAAVRTQIAAQTAILEGEALAINESTGEFYPFQVTMQRKRTHDVAAMAREFPLALVTFDLLYVNGEDYTNVEYAVRRTTLEQLITTNERIRIVERIVTDRAQQLQQFFDEQIERGLEGIIAKRLTAPYAAGARNFNWIKLKRTYRGQLRDTIDTVILGYFRGRGMRARLGIGALLVGVYHTQKDLFQTIAKIGSGLSAGEWVRVRERLDGTRVLNRSPRVDSQITPDVWVEPTYVITVIADEITRSPRHTCGRDEGGAGLALRFPRALGFIRDDKSPEDATTVEEIQEMYAMQP